jgi:hypothetical protein
LVRSIIERKPSFMDAPNFYAHFELNQIRLAIKGVISPRSNDLLHFQVPDLLAEERRLHKIGILPTSPWKESDEGYRRLIYCDPDGQPICVFDWIVRSPGWDI